MEDEFGIGIGERHATLERKLKFTSKKVRTLIELLHGSHALRVERYIVFLIVGEIALSAGGLLTRL